jgi:hypothetical protein
VVEQPIELPLHGGAPKPVRGRAPVSIGAVRPYVARGRVPLDLVPTVAAPDAGGGADNWQRSLPPLLLLLAGPAVLALIVLDAPAWLRAGPVLLYVGAVPGYAVVRLLRLPDLLMTALLGVGLSLALGLLVAQLMIYMNLWSPLLGLSTLVALASVAASVELLPGKWSARPAEEAS